MAMVLFLSTFGELFELHICEFVETASHGLGCLCPSIFVLVNIFSVELFGTVDIGLYFEMVNLFPTLNRRICL
jgi:hypothetical protein